MKLIVNSCVHYSYEVEIDDMTFIAASDNKLLELCEGEDPVIPAQFIGGKLIPFCAPSECEFEVESITTEDNTVVINFDNPIDF